MDEDSKKRPSWDEYFMAIAREVSTRATCDRLHVGAVIVRDRNILATGYNGSVPGSPHCDEVGHDMEDGHCVRTVHAEANAIYQAAKHGARIEGATLYTTAFPCWPCFRSAVSAGIKMVVFGKIYRPDARILPFASGAVFSIEGPSTYWIVWPAIGTEPSRVGGPFERDEASRRVREAPPQEGVRIYGIHPAF